MYNTLMNKIVCVAGMPGAGKSVISDYFVNKGYQFVRFGQITLDIIKENKLPLNETTERKIREDLRKKHGMAAFAVLNYPKFKKLLKSGNVIADGLYSWSEYKYLKEKFKKQFTLIAVYAPPKLRYVRISKRVMPKSDINLRFRTFSKKEAKSRDYSQIENLEQGGPIAMADFTIVNTKSKAYLLKQVKKIHEEIENKK
jgi:dephospho-CoA kinase